MRLCTTEQQKRELKAAAFKLLSVGFEYVLTASHNKEKSDLRYGSLYVKDGVEFWLNTVTASVLVAE